MDKRTQGTRIPIIQMGGIHIVSIQVALDDALVLELKEDIARTIYDYGGRGVIIDVSGIDVMDSFITRAIFDIASITSLMGVKTVLCGISPTIAMTLVEMGLGMEGIETTMDLESAYEMLKQQEPEEQLQDEWDITGPGAVGVETQSEGGQQKQSVKGTN